LTLPQYLSFKTLYVQYDNLRMSKSTQNVASSLTFIHSIISGMYHYECIVPNVNIILQSGRC